MGVQNRVLEAAAGHPIHAGPRGVAVQGELSIPFQKRGEPKAKEITLIVVSEGLAKKGYASRASRLDAPPSCR